MRDGQEVPPIHPGRACETVAVSQGMARIEDVGCFGVYQYPPEAFVPGATLTLRVVNEDRPQDPEVIPLDPDLVCRVYRDFVPYFRAVAEPGSPTPECTITGP